MHIQENPTSQADGLVPLAQAQALAARLSELGVPHALLDVLGANHDCDTRVSSACSQATLYGLERFLATVAPVAVQKDQKDLR